MLYDHYVSLLKHDTNIDSILPGIIEYNNNNNQDNILILGNKLAKYIFFEKDVEIENIFLQKTSNNYKSIDTKLIDNKKRLYSKDDSYSSYNSNFKKHKLIYVSGGKRRKTKKRKTKKRITRKRKESLEKNKIN